MSSVSNFRNYVIVGMLAAAFGPRLQADDYAQWAKSIPIYLKTDPDGANVAGTVKNFPILVRLNAGNFTFSQAKGKGQDLRFSTSAGKHLKYQVDRWDSTKALAEVWVKMDSVKGNANDQSLNMHWGNAAAADSSDGEAVFDSANGFVGVWHLGGSGTVARSNSVKGGWDAEAIYFDGGETTAGMIGLADSLDGDAPTGDMLQIGDGYGELSKGFTFSIWCKPAAASNSARLLDLGNGPGLDEVVLHRVGTSQSIIFENYQANNLGRSNQVDNCFPTGQWQQFTVTVAGSKMKLYRNGSLIAEEDNAGYAITDVRRAYNYMGKNDWVAGSFFKGILDEPQLSKTARSPDWIKLGYANQGTVQSLVSFTKTVPPVTCIPTFSIPKDTTLSEGTTLVLNGSADCAVGFNWSAVAGPAPRILDPESRDLQVFLPRIASDTSVVYRFTVSYPDSDHYQNVTVAIRADIPDPIFTMPVPMDWNGQDSVLIKPVISNLAAIKASKQPDLHYSWVLAGMEADTAWRDGGLMLKSAADEGELTLNVCVDNNGPTTCKSMIVTVKIPTGLLAGRLKVRNGPSAASPSLPGFDAAGRALQAGSAGRPAGSGGRPGRVRYAPTYRTGASDSR